ncbi:MAG TPA: hypothetical protein VM118_03905 [Acidobacteriota bacterium]|nr:hypothetical protein [Acidobacteriota bacterium]
MIKKITTATAAILFLGFLLAIPAEARRGDRHCRVAAKSSSVQTQTQRGVCPYGNTPGSGRMLSQRPGRASTGRFGPDDGSGVGRVRPQDGTGHGAIAQGRGRMNNAYCDGTGLKGRHSHRGNRRR